MNSNQIRNISDISDEKKIGEIYFINKTFRILCNCGTKFNNIKIFTKHFLENHLNLNNQCIKVLEEIFSNKTNQADALEKSNEENINELNLIKKEIGNIDDFENIITEIKDFSNKTSKSDSQTLNYNIISVEHNYDTTINESNLNKSFKDKTDCIYEDDKADCINDDDKDKNDCLSDNDKNECTTDDDEDGVTNDEEDNDCMKDDDNDDLIFIGIEKPIEDNEKAQNEDELNIRKKTWNCSLCGESFAKRKGFVNHKLIIHNEEHVPGEEEACCKICGEYFKTAKGLKKHEHHKHFRKIIAKYKCKWCDTMFIKPEYRAKHENTKHDSRGNKIIRKWNPTFKYICETCGNRFSLPWKLREHIRTHTGERPLQCDVCDKSFAKKRELRIHKYSHMEDPPYKCDYCDKGFFEKGMFNSHEMIHTGGYKATCELCDKKFRSRSDLNRHMRRTHKMNTKK